MTARRFEVAHRRALAEELGIRRDTNRAGGNGVAEQSLENAAVPTGTSTC
jgi:hypothetical protein